MYWGSPCPASRRSFSLAWAMSRATTMGPVSITRVFTGWRESVARISSIGRLRSMCTTSSLSSSCVTSGRKRAGSVSSASTKMPSLVILPSAWRSALHDTANETGQLAPWRGRRMTRTSWQKYLPPNCAPMPVSWDSLRIFASRSVSRKPLPRSDPDVGSESRYRVLASFAVSTACSADVPPMTTARWYGGHAAVPSVIIFSNTHGSSAFSLRSAFVSWKR